MRILGKFFYIFYLYEIEINLIMETTNATKFVEKLTDDPSLLYRKPEQAKESLHAIL